MNAKNTNELEQLAVSIVKKAALGIMPFLSLSIKELSQAQSLFSIDSKPKDVRGLLHKLSTFPKPTKHENFLILINAVQIMLEDVERTFKCIEKDKSINLEEPQGVTKVLQMIPKISYAYDFISMSFVFSEMMRLSSSVEKEVTTLADFLSKQHEIPRLEVIKDALGEVGDRIASRLHELIHTALDKSLDEKLPRYFKNITESVNQDMRFQFEKLETIKGEVNECKGIIQEQSVRNDLNTKEISDLKSRTDRHDDCPVCKNATEYEAIIQKVKPLIAQKRVEDLTKKPKNLNE